MEQRKAGRKTSKNEMVNISFAFCVEIWYNLRQEISTGKEPLDMKRILLLMLLFGVLLCGCASEAAPQQTTTAGTTAQPPATTVQQTTTVPPATTVPPTTVPVTTVPPTTAPVLPYAAPLTGEPLAQPQLQRPIAVMLNNIKDAMPQHGVSQADILYEVLAEGGITRCMGIYGDISDVEKIGSIRSARKYYVDLARGYNAAYVHAGGSAEASSYLTGLRSMNLDAGYSATHFYRDQWRLNNGYSIEHTLFSSGEKILSFAATQNVSTTLSEEKTYGMTFAETPEISGQSGKKMTVYFHLNGRPSGNTKKTVLTYDPEDGNYDAAQHGGSYVDGNTWKGISFRNVVVLRCATNLQSGGLLLTVQTTGSGTGYFACDGKMIPIRWSRSSVTEPFRFTTESGDPVVFGVGSTYIAVVPNGASVVTE